MFENLWGCFGVLPIDVKNYYIFDHFQYSHITRGPGLSPSPHIPIMCKYYRMSATSCNLVMHTNLSKKLICQWSLCSFITSFFWKKAGLILTATTLIVFTWRTRKWGAQRCGMTISRLRTLVSPFCSGSSAHWPYSFPPMKPNITLKISCKVL